MLLFRDLLCMFVLFFRYFYQDFTVFVFKQRHTSFFSSNFGTGSGSATGSLIGSEATGGSGDLALRPNEDAIATYEVQ